MITMQAFLDDYKNGLSLGAALDSFISQNPKHQLALAMKKMHLAFADFNKFEAAIIEANQVNYKEYEVEEQLLFFYWLCHLNINAKRIANATSIIATINRLLINPLPPEYQYIPIDLKGELYEIEGNFYKRIETLEECLKILTPKSGRFKVLLWSYISSLCEMHETEKFEKNLKLYIDLVKGNPFERRIDHLILMKNLEAGIFKDFPILIQNILGDKTLSLPIPYILSCQKIYRIFVENNYDFLNEADPEDWLYLSCVYLLKNDPKKALIWAHKYAENNMDSKMQPTFVNYFLIRAELANKNINSTEYYLESRKKSSNTSIFDDFYWFRIYHIKGDTNKAQHYFNLFVSNVDKYNLNSRFDIELKLSPELSLTNIRDYTRNLAKPETANFIKIDESIKPIKEDALDFIIGDSLAINQVKTLIKKYSAVDTTVLITGETGTGKELVAKALWQAGPYKSQPFIPINCGAISDHLLQSELFGHKKGAFTGAHQNHKGVFEEAGEGIVFLDEIGEISSAMQVNLLRVLEAKEVCAQ